MKKYCTYFQAHIPRPLVIRVVSLLKSYDNICFDRALDGSASIFEFFVPSSMVPEFKSIMAEFQRLDWVQDLQEKENRLLAEKL